MVWVQKEFKIGSFKRGCHLITHLIEEQIQSELAAIQIGICHIFLKHSSASLTINENADPDVRTDMETYLSTTIPEGRSAAWIHSAEGPDDMPAHIKSSLFSVSHTIPITNGRLNLGTWQGIWICEHRDSPHSRKIVVTLNGE
eukprot:TRINITY_DN13364_c0_g4_i1.p3 TRINITY_DN13364_c0_g4~~TRINITY_DN13364_c0_g4_i1.p3  ORF type:complete len:143 (-),score=3.90 TRINITY_DN13364_c0_g4_i1:138-566(-)